MKVGIFGGTFDPIHIEHINMALSAKEELGLDKLYIVPAYVSPFKTAYPVTAPVHRLNMVNLAFMDEPNIAVSDYEIKQGGASYTYKTVQYFKKMHPKDKLYLIIGGDSLGTFFNWYNPDIIAKNVDIAVVLRDGDYTEVDKSQKKFKKAFNKEFITLSYKGASVSATKVRMTARFCLPLDEFLPKAVEDYVVKYDLYADSPYLDYLKSVMTDSRLKHTVNVVTAAMTKAKELKLDEEKVYLAATLHDVAKYLNPDDYPGFVYKGIPKQVVHAFLGAYVLENVLGVTDKDVIDAVRYHTTAKAPMTTLQKLIFTADMIEDGRTYDGVEELRKIYYTESLDKAFKECLKEEVKHLTQKGYELFTETRNAYDYYILKQKDVDTNKRR